MAVMPQTVNWNDLHAMNLGRSGLELRIEQPHHYLEILGYIIQNQFSDPCGLIGILQEIRSVLDINPTVLSAEERKQVNFEGLSVAQGWHHHFVLESMIHREWLRSDTNEFDAHKVIFERSRFLQSAQHVVLLGAGLCRLAGFLCRQERIETIVCSDLSTLALFCGKALIEGRYSELPKELRKLVTQWKVEGEKKLVKQVREPSFIEEDIRHGDLKYRVENAFGIRSEIDKDLYCLVYLLDALIDFRTVLLRVAEQLNPGQRIFLLSSITSDRNPQDLVDWLQKLNFSIDSMHFERMPYSHSPHDYRYIEHVSHVIVLEATKVGTTDLVAMRLQENNFRAEQLVAYLRRPMLPGQRYFPLEASSEQIVAINRGLASKKYGEFCRILGSELGDQDGSKLATLLFSRRLLQVQPG